MLVKYNACIMNVQTLRRPRAQISKLSRYESSVAVYNFRC